MSVIQPSTVQLIPSSSQQLPRPDAPDGSFSESTEQFSFVLQVALPQELSLQVQTGRRLPEAEWMLQRQQRIEQWAAQTAAQNTMPLSYPMWESWSDSPDATWPESLRNFWSKIDNQFASSDQSDRVQAVVNGIRAHYANDAELSALADWIEYWAVRGVKLEMRWFCKSTPYITQRIPFKYVLDVKS